MNSAAKVANSLYLNYPDYLKVFFDGASLTSGICLERLKLCNAVEYVEGVFLCSAMAVWNDYGTGKLVFGRNYDAANYKEIDKDLVVTVFHPENRIAAATVGYAGELYCVNGMNAKGLFIELNNGMPSAGDEIHWNLCPSTSSLFSMLFEAEKMKEIMSTPLETGGPMHSLTRYQIVAVPEDMILHINIPSNGKWVELKMNDFFDHRKR